MSWLRVDDGFMRNRKIARLSNWGFRLHMGGLCYCAANLTDGALEARAVRVIAAEIDLRRPRPVIVELVEGDLWLPTGTGYLVKDFLDYNPRSDRVKEEREKARERMKRIRSGERSPHVRGEVFGDPVPSRTDQKTLGESGLFSLERVAGAAARAASTGSAA